MASLFMLVWCVFASQTPFLEVTTLTVPIGGLFDLEGYENNGHSELTGARVAIQHINDRMENVKLQLYINDSKCNPGIATDALFDFIYRKPRVAVVVGSGCSDVTETLAEIVPYWNTVLVMRSFVDILYKNNITVKESVELDKDLKSMQEQLSKLKVKDARIIIAASSEQTGRQILCEAFRLHLCDPRHVWMFVGNFEEEWWKETDGTNCTLSQMKQAINGSIITGSTSRPTDVRRKVHNVTKEDFLSLYIRLNGSFPLSPYTYSAYDSMWTVALALQTLHKDGLLSAFINASFKDRERLMNKLMDIISKINFLGLSGLVSFDGSDRMEGAALFQIQDGYRKLVAVHDVAENHLNDTCSECQDIVWRNRGQIPRDSRLILVKHMSIHATVSVIIFFLSSTGIVMSFSFLAFNFHHRKQRFIKLSSPKLNNITLLGCVCVYTGIFLLGFDGQPYQDNFFSLLCHGKSFVFSVGFSMAFGSMFTKTYRVHQIFTHVNNGIVRNKMLHDKHLLMIVSILALIDILATASWILIDPMNKYIRNLTNVELIEEEDILYVYQTTQCGSVHMEKWLSGFYAFKGLLLVFGSYMAWETRSVSIPALNDSRYIGLSVYNVVVMSVVVVVLSNILSDEPILAVILESLCILVSTTLVICFLFIPKAYSILRRKQECLPSGRGIVVSANTRRFPVDDKQEREFRAEVQNRAFKKELIELEQEVSRLEKLLKAEPKPYPVISEDVLSLLPESLVDHSPVISSYKRKLSIRSTDLSSLVDMSSDSSEESVYLTLFPPRVTLSRAPVKLRKQNTYKAKVFERKGRSEVWRITLRKLNDVEQMIDIIGIDVNDESVLPNQN